MMLPKTYGRYEIRSEIGRGGMATVYLGYDPTFRRPVAIKVLPPQYLENPVLRARFEREAHAIATIEHPAIVPVYDYGEAGGQLYLVMRFMAGGSLADKIKSGPLPLDWVSETISQLAPALNAVHNLGIVHRDLKPGNILFDGFGNPALSDFGIVQFTEATTQLTGEAIIGTPAYMSPEQVQGSLPLDGRSDLYALGIVLFEMLSGRLPYQADTPLAVLMMHLADPIPEIHSLRPDLPPEISRILNKALSKNRDGRYSHAVDLAYDLRHVPGEGGETPVRAADRSPAPDFQADATVLETTPEGPAGSYAAPGPQTPAPVTPPQEQAGSSEVARPSQPAGQVFEPPGETGAALTPAPEATPATPAGGIPGDASRPATGPLPPVQGQPGRRLFPVACLVGLVGGLVVLALLAASGWTLFSWIRSRWPVAAAPQPSLTAALPSPIAATQPVTALAPTSGPASPGPAGTVLFEDNFSDASTGWPEGGRDQGAQWGYLEGRYRLRGLEVDTLYWVTPGLDYTDTSTTVSIEKRSGDNQGYFGVLCRIQANKQFYYLVLRGDGRYTIGKYQNEQFNSLLPAGWMYSDAINHGNVSNTLRADCVGDLLTLWVNGQKLNQARDDDFPSGDIGLGASAAGATGIEVLFDQFTVRGPEAGQ